MKFNRELSSKYGYTLLELIVVLSLFAIVFSLAIPSIKSIFINMEKRELMTFRRDIIYARNSAIVENVNYVLFIDKANNSYQIKKQGNKEEIIRNVKFENGIKIVKNNFYNTLRFSPTGSPNRAGSVELTNMNGDVIEITITPATGKVNLYINGK
ncbi:MAG: prepilin-type N-terminal cleavage/methylation domain-containing protein [Tissierellia bacterium]|nr:prepilin-type N-terminal cleavage/methylation domain-containing protein [Tissierellia bacterium]